MNKMLVASLKQITLNWEELPRHVPGDEMSYLLGHFPEPHHVLKDAYLEFQNLDSVVGWRKHGLKNLVIMLFSEMNFAAKNKT